MINSLTQKILLSCTVALQVTCVYFYTTVKPLLFIPNEFIPYGFSICIISDMFCIGFLLKDTVKRREKYILQISSLFILVLLIIMLNTTTEALQFVAIEKGGNTLGYTIDTIDQSSGDPAAIIYCYHSQRDFNIYIL